MNLAEIDAKLTGPGGPFELVEETVLGERMQVFKNRMHSLREMLESSAVHGDKEFIVWNERRIRYDEHIRLVASVANALQDQYGIQKGDRVAILAENRPEWILTLWATLSLGGIVAALNGWWTPDEIHYGLEHSDPKVLVGDRKRLARIDWDPGLPVIEMESQFEALEKYAPEARLPDTPIDEDDPAVILYTSGTTGRPKGAVNSHRGILGFCQANLVGGLRMLMLKPPADGPPDPAPPLPMCSLVTAPLFHLSGLFAGAIMYLGLGAKTVWRSGRFDPADVLRLIEAEKVTAWGALGNMAHRVVSHPDVAKYDLSSMQNVGSGGAPTSPEIQRRIREVFPKGGANMGIGYGSSESVSVIASIGGTELLKHPTSVGPIQISTEVEIRDPEGKVLTEGAEGEIFARSAYIMLEYWRNPEATREAIRPGRWLATGDIGHLADGRLYINSRARDMILRAAENIHPSEIEHRLEEHASVAEVAVFGVDHEELGQEVKAVVVPADAATVDTDELGRHVAEKLASFKVPAHWEIRNEPLPRNAAGKVLKNVLRGEAENTFIEE